MIILATKKISDFLIVDGNVEITKIPEKIHIYLKSISDYTLPILAVIAIIIASGYVLFSHQEGWKKFIAATIGTVIMFLSVDFTVILKTTIEKEASLKEPNILEVFKGVFILLKEISDGIFPIASIAAFIGAALCVMFSSQTGWKKTMNAFFGSLFGFGAVLIVNAILSKFNNFL